MKVELNLENKCAFPSSENEIDASPYYGPTELN